ncbi:MAG: transcriptional repressor LexA [Burkholderiaceae bacterium]|jgi:repressor LexA
MASKLTPRQQQILELIEAEITRTGFPPTRAEIAQALGFKSANAAEDHLRALARKGAIELTPGASRGIRVPASRSTLAGSTLPTGPALTALPAGSQFLLPVVGRVAAGSPILATQHIEREIAVEPTLFSQPPHYLLKVRGASMKDIGILDGDLLAVRKSAEARSGQIVVARIGDDVTVKRLEKTGSGIRLLPENPDYQPIIVSPSDDFSLEGIAVGLIRSTPLG